MSWRRKELRQSATMIFTMLNRINSVPAPWVAFIYSCCNVIASMLNRCQRTSTVPPRYVHRWKYYWLNIIMFDMFNAMRNCKHINPMYIMATVETFASSHWVATCDKIAPCGANANRMVPCDIHHQLHVEHVWSKDIRYMSQSLCVIPTNSWLYVNSSSFYLHPFLLT